MDCSRRSFLKTSGLLASGLALSGIPFLSSCNSAKNGVAPFGLQLWTLRDVIFDNPESTLRQVAEAGYKQIESFDGPDGIFWGMGNRNFKELMDELGMTMVSSHANVFEDFERKADQAAEIGVEYLICPWIGPQDTLDDYKAIADQFNQIGQTANNAGVKFAYHNHDYTFVEMDGELPQTVLMERTDPDLVEQQMDIYWFVAAGQDPAEWIQRYPGRFTSCHVKDLANGDEPESTVLGTGTINFSELLPLAKENGMKYFIVEQEAYTGTTPLDAIVANAEYMRELGI